MRLRGYIAIMLICAILCWLVLCSGCARIQAWTIADYSVGGAYAATRAMDWRQTREISHHPDRWIETNRYLGPHPSKEAVDSYFLFTTVAMIAVAHVAPAVCEEIWSWFSDDVSDLSGLRVAILAFGAVKSAVVVTANDQKGIRFYK